MARIWISLSAIVVAVALAAPRARAYPQYSENGNATYCRACHGDFRASSYYSFADGESWGVNLHILHRDTMLAGDCTTCHGSGPRFPVLLNSSSGGDGLDAISCVGCHGRADDDNAGNPDHGTRGGYGAGLRQHHTNAGVTVCKGCHLDADPSRYTPVGEDVLPPYYANPGTNHPSIPSDPCNPAGGEDFAGASTGLDNDGDGFYDGVDSDCAGAPDAGLPDAGWPDAGWPDAGWPDAGFPDAGVADAASDDAAVQDAGWLDAATLFDGGDGLDAPTADAGSSGDAVSGSPDAYPVGPDAGDAIPAEDAAGCGCRTGGDGASGGWWFGLAVVWEVVRRRRRRPRRARRSDRCRRRSAAG